MKRILLVLLMVFPWVSAMAKPVDASVARSVAETYLSAMGFKNPGALQNVTSQTSFTEFYVFSAPEGGFIIVSADDCVIPVLGYSVSNVFDAKGIPEHVQSWLEGYEREIRWWKARGGRDTRAAADGVDSVALEWRMLQSGEMPPMPLSTSVGTLMTTTWGQSPYYNNLCPGNSLTGCVATATAQIMKYHNHPATGYDSHTYTSSSNGYVYPNLTADFGATTYQWSQMPNALSSSSSAAHIDAVATLMYHVGVSVDMGYSPSWSGSFNYFYRGKVMRSSQRALMRYFKYRADMTPVSRDDYNNAEWKSLLRAELDQNRPILFDGEEPSSGGGHSFVIDGYNASGKFHVNWGWKGSYNGYFAMGALNPSSSGAGGNSSSSYNVDNVALMGIRPHTEWSTSGTTTFNVVSSGNGTVTGSGSYNFGDTVNMLATANPGYRFDGWSDGCKFNPRQTIANGGTYSFTANFVPVSGDTVHFCPGGRMINYYGTSSGVARYWGIHLPASVLNADSSLKAVQLYVREAGELGLTIYTGANHSTIAAQTTATFLPGDERQWHTILLPNPVPATSDIWIIFSCNTGSPIAATYYGGAEGAFIISYNTSNFTDVSSSYECSAMIKGIFCNCTGPSCNITSIPYSNNFDDGEAECWDVVDVNNDGVAWELYGSSGYEETACYRIRYAVNSDDWLMAPPLATAGTYTVEWKAKIQTVSYPETYQVLWYDGTNTTPLFQETLSSTSYVDRSVNFTVPEGGNGRIVFRYISDDKFYFYIDNVVIRQYVPPVQYTITTASSNDNWGTVTGGGTYDEGSAVTLTATPATGYQFSQWQDGNTQNPRTVTVTGDATYTATFAVASYTVTATSNFSSRGSVSGGGTYTHGSTATLTATPAEHCHFVQWQDGNTDNPRTVTVTSNATYTATFALDTYILTVASNNNAWGTVTGGGTYSYGNNVSLSASPATGYHFVQWNDGNTQNPRTVTVIDNATYTATFAANTFIVTVASNNPAWGTVAGGGTYGYQATANLTATPATGYRFVQWQDGNTQNPRSVTVTSNVTYTATFELIPPTMYSLTVMSNNPAWGTVGGGGIFENGSSAILTATPAEGYHFVEWNDGDTNATRTVTVTGSVTFTATFAINSYSLAATSNNSDWGTVTGGGTYDYNDTATLTAIAAEGYHFVEWNDGDTNAVRMVTVVSDTVFTATFTINTYTLTVTSNNELWGTVMGGGTYDYNGVATLTAVAAEGYHFVAWNDGDTNATRMVTVISDTSFVSTFAINSYTVTVTGNDESYGAVTGGGIYVYNDTAILTAIAAEGYHFVAWNDGDTNAVRTIVVAGDIAYIATFAINGYTLAATSNNDNWGTVTGAGVYDYNSTATITATAAEGYHFVAWNDGDTNATRMVAVVSDSSFTALFAINSYTVTVASNNELWGTAGGGGTYNHNDTATLTAMPAENCHFVEWNDGDTNATRTVTVTGSVTYTATFAINSYSLVATSNNDAWGTVTGDGTYGHGDVVTLTVIAAVGYHFVEWNDGDTNTVRTVTVLSDTSFTATFAINSYTLVVASNNDAWGTVTGGGNYDHNDVATLTATPADGYHFVEWNDGDTNAVRTVTVISDTSFTATFAINSYTLVVASNNDDWGTVAGGGNYDHNDVATLTAIAADGYHFVEWNDGDTNAVRTVTMVSDTVFTATFAINSYALYVASNNDAWGTVTGGGTYVHNDTATLTATPAEGYRFVEWNDGDTNATRTIMVVSDTSFVAIFEIDRAPDTAYYTVRVNRVCNNCSEDIPAGLVTGVGVYPEGYTVRLDGLDYGYFYFEFWIDEAGDTLFANPYFFEIVTDRNLTAVFGVHSGILEGEESKLNVDIYPNPVTDRFTVRSDSEFPIQATLLDVNGRRILSQVIGCTGNRMSVFDVSGLASGQYFLRLSTSNATVVRKIIVR